MRLLSICVVLGYVVSERDVYERENGEVVRSGRGGRILQRWKRKKRRRMRGRRRGG